MAALRHALWARCVSPVLHSGLAMSIPSLNEPTLLPNLMQAINWNRVQDH